MYSYPWKTTEKALKRCTNEQYKLKKDIVDTMKYTPQERTDQTRKIFELWHETPRISNKDMWEILGVMYRTLRQRVTEAVDQGYIVGPQLIKKSYKNFAEYIYFAEFKYPGEMYQKYIENNDVIFHAIMEGFSNFRIVSRTELDIDALLYGLRTDYLISFPPYRDWMESIQYMRTMVQQFDPKEYTPKKYITNHWDKIIEWTKEYEILYEEFKYDLRLPFDPIARDKHNIYGRVAYEWLDTIQKYCTVFTSYYPESISAYEPYVYVFETDYEDFVIELFSQLPTTVWFFKVTDKLLLYTWMKRGSMKIEDYRTPEIGKLHTFLMLRELLKKGIIKSELHAVDQFYWRKEAVL